MRILFASQSFYPHIGGVSTYLLNLARELTKKGSEVTELHLRPSDQNERGEIDGISIIRVPKGPLDTETLKGYSRFKETIYKECHRRENFIKPIHEIEGYKDFEKINNFFGKQISDWSRHNPNEIIHIHDFQLLFLYKFVPRDTPLILTWHIPFTSDMSPTLARFLTKHMREYDKVVFSSPEYIEAAIKFGLPREKIEHIYPIANTDLFTKLDIDAESVKKKYGIPRKAKTILCVQRIDPKSGHEQLIRAMQHIIKKVPEARLVFVGGDSLSNKISKDREVYKQRVMNLIKQLGLTKYIIFTGNIEYTQLPELYNAVYVNALTSRLEGFGLAVTEGMACGKPIIGNNAGGIPLQVEDGINGFLVEVNDIKDTANKLITLLTNGDLRRKMGNASLKIIKEKFGMKVGIKKHIDLYNELIRTKKGNENLAFLPNLQEIQALITDYDRTITTDEPGKLTKKIITELKSLKKDLILVTGRELTYVKDLYKKYPIWKCIVAENGSIIYLPKSGNVITIDNDYTTKIKQIIKKNKIPSDEGSVIISCPLNYESKIKQLLKEFNSHITYSTNIDKIMILPREANKRIGLSLALNYLEINKEKTIVIGDGENDEEMFTLPGYKIALENAHPSIKKLANKITKEPYYKGVLETITKLKK